MCVNQGVFSDTVTVEDVCSGCSFCMTENTKQRNRTTVGGVLRGEKMRNYSRRSTERREDEELLNHSVGCMLIMAMCASESADKLKDGICFSSSTKLLVKFCLMF